MAPTDKACVVTLIFTDAVDEERRQVLMTRIKGSIGIFLNDVIPVPMLKSVSYWGPAVWQTTWYNIYQVLRDCPHIVI